MSKDSQLVGYVLFLFFCIKVLNLIDWKRWMVYQYSIGDIVSTRVYRYLKRKNGKLQKVFKTTYFKVKVIK